MQFSQTQKLKYEADHTKQIFYDEMHMKEKRAIC